MWLLASVFTASCWMLSPLVCWIDHFFLLWQLCEAMVHALAHSEFFLLLLLYPLTKLRKNAEKDVKWYTARMIDLSSYFMTRALSESSVHWPPISGLDETDRMDSMLFSFTCGTATWGSLNCIGTWNEGSINHLFWLINMTCWPRYKKWVIFTEV